MNVSKGLAELLFNAMVKSDQDEIIIALLKTIKEQYSVVELGEELFLQLQKAVPHIKEKRTRAAIIETMVEFPDFNFDYEILDEYLTLVFDYQTNNEDAIRCLKSFTVQDLFKEVIFLRLAQFTDKQRALEILVGIGGSNWGEIPAEYQQFDDQVRSGIRMRNRTFIISQFLYFVHPLCREYSYINHLAAHYPTMQSARNDWAWRLPGSTDHIINSKIVTSREAEVFIKLGQLLHEKVHLTSVVKKGLYSAFFEGKDPIDVIFNLPQ